MPAYNRVVLEGILADGVERWATGCNFQGESPDTVQSPSDLNQWAEQIGILLTTLAIPTLLQGISTVGAITRVRTYFYPDIGAPAATVGAETVDVSGTGTANKPLSTSWVLSLRTGLAGRRYRGRMYWPAMTNGVGPTGRFSTGQNADVAAQAVLLLNGIASVAPGTTDMQPHVVSGVGGFMTPVIDVAVGDVPDSQRRRRDALVEEYAIAAL